MVDQTVYMRSQVGGLDLENIEQVTDTEITCLLKTRTVGRGVRVSMRVEADEPHNIADIRLAPAGGPSARTAPVTRMDEAEAIVALREELEKRMAFANALLTHKLLDAHDTEILTSGKVDAEWGGKVPDTWVTRPPAARGGTARRVLLRLAAIQ